MQYGIAFTPLVPSLVLWLALAVIVAIAGLLLLTRARGAAIRVTALALVLLALVNPSFTREEREPLSSVAEVVIDKSPSQHFGERTRETAQSQAALLDSLKKIKGWRCGWSRPARPTARPMAPNCSARCLPCCRIFRSVSSPAPS